MKLTLNNIHASFVNLDSRRDRLVKMKETLARVGIVAIRQRGMLPEEYMGDPALIACMRSRPQKGAIGCYMSQLTVMSDALAFGKHAFVMEDDLVFCSDFLKRLGIISEFCETHPWDVIWLCGTFHVNPPWWHKNDIIGRDAARTDNPRMIRTYGAFCTHAYIVNHRSIPNILQRHHDILPKSMGIDWSFIHMPDLLTYAFVPGCIIQYDNQSNIGHGMTIFSNFGKKLGPYWFQDRMEQFDPTTYNWHEAHNPV